MRLQRGKRFADMLLERERNGEQAAVADRARWYLPRTEQLSSTASQCFQLSYMDPPTQQFLDDSTTTSGSCCLQFYYAFSSAFLSMFLTKTSINGILSRGGMFLFSSEQIREFLDLPVEWDPRGKMLLDLGSGDGGVTQSMESLFGNIYVTEMCTVMQWRLQQRGYTVLDVDKWASPGTIYHLISALNLLDRHFNPQLLLRDLRSKALESNCNVLLSLVLPVRQYVEFHPNKTSSRPDIHLTIAGRTYEEQVNSLIDGEFKNAGFEVVKWTKLPYLCEGDFYRPYYLLDDALFLLRPIPSLDGGHLHHQPYAGHTHIEL